MGKGSVRFLSIIAIAVLFAGGWYSLISTSVAKKAQYDEYLEIARKKAKDGIEATAEENYLNALNMNDSMELRKEIADFYRDYDETGDFLELCESTIAAYPHEADGYEWKAEYYVSVESYTEFFEVVNQAQKRKVSSSSLDKLVKEHYYEYEITTTSFSEVRDFSAGSCAAMREDGLWGYVSESGNSYISFRYKDAEPFTGAGLAAVKQDDDRYVLISTSGTVLSVDTEKHAIEDCGCLVSGKIAVKYDGKYHYFDSDLKELFGEYDYAGAFWCGAAAVREGDDWFIINEDGKKITKDAFEDIKVDDRGIAFFDNVALAKRDGKYILINTEGKQVGDNKFDDADSFNSGEPAAVKIGDLWGFVDTSGEIVVKGTYESAKSFSNGLAAVENENGKWGYISSDGYKEAIPAVFAGANDFSEGGCAFIYEDGEWTLLRLYRLS